MHCWSHLRRQFYEVYVGGNAPIATETIARPDHVLLPGLVVVLLNTLLALPSVVVGLIVYLLLSRSGPLGSWGILFTPTAMVIAQTILVLPVIAALTRQLVGDSLRDGGDQLRSMGARPITCALLMLVHDRWAVLTILIAAFGRAIAEVGAVMIVGGNIDGVTRVMTTSIALETSKGDLPLALARHATSKIESLDDLARIYQAMKPKAAAAVFEQLTLDVQVKAVRLKDPRSRWGSCSSAGGGVAARRSSDQSCSRPRCTAKPRQAARPASRKPESVSSNQPPLARGVAIALAG